MVSSVVDTQVGDFYFPSQQSHFVYPFRTADGKGERRSVSFNAIFLLKEKSKNNKKIIKDKWKNFKNKIKGFIKEIYQHINGGIMSKETVDVELALDDKTIVQLSLAAHEHKMTLNDFILRVLEDKIKESDYQFENGTKPQLLNETE